MFPLKKTSIRFIMSWLVFFLGIMNLLSSLYPALLSHRQVIRELFTVEFQYGGRLTVMVLGFLLLILATHIRRGKKSARWLVIFLLLLSAGAHLIKGFDWEEAVLSFTLAIIFLMLPKEFQRQSDPIRLKTLPQNALGLLLAIIIYGVSGFAVLDQHFAQPFHVATALTDTLSAVLTLYEPPNQHLTYHAARFIDSLYVLGIFWYLFCLGWLLSPVLNRQKIKQSDLEKAERIVSKYGLTPLAQFCLYGDKNFFFWKNSFLAYKNAGNVCLVLGDPVGPPTELMEIVQKFQKLTHRNDWLLSFFQTRQATLPVYEALNLQAIAIGQEAVVEVDRFSLDGKPGKDARNVKNKIEKLGYSFQEWRYSEIENSRKFEVLKTISNAWLSGHRNKEMHFSLGWFEKTFLTKQSILVVLNDTQKAVAFVTLTPQYGQREVAIDLMRYNNNLPNGIMDYLFIQTLAWAQQQQIARVNLGLSPLAGVGDLSQDSFVEKMLRQVYLKTNARYSFQGLYAFKNKFRPNWEKKYLFFERQTDLPRIAKALLDAHQRV
jgi:phosphatidylglycerol lysyltransferase